MAEKKKILYIVEAMGGGVFTYIVDLANELVDTYDMYIAYAVRKQTPSNYKDYFDKRIHMIEVKNFARAINATKDIAAFFEIRKIAKEIKPDIIHLHSSKAGALGRFAFSGKRVPLFYTPHGYSFLMQNSSEAKRKIYKGIMLIVDYAKNKSSKNKKWLFGCVFLLVLNPAVSSIVYLGILGLVWISYKDILEVKKFSGIKIGRIVLVVFVIAIIGWSIISNADTMLNSNNYLLKRVGISIQQLQIIVSGAGTLMYSSESIRLSGIVYDLKLLAERPLLGFGLGSVSCNSGVVTMLVNAGILGFVAWYYTINRYMNIEKSLSEAVFSIYIVIFPSVFLNDYETIFCIIIPIVLRCFKYLGISNYAARTIKSQNA